MVVIKCKMCGGDLVLTEGSPVAECAYCGSLQTVPNADSEKKLTLFRRANRLRAGCEFDKAFGVYELILADFPEEAEAYWGLVLCKFGIEYVDDPATGKKVPTCHRSSYESLLEDTDFEQTLEYADPVSRKLYRAEAKQIEDIRKGILDVSVKEAPYDIFICYKETDADGQRTLDSVLAQDLYDMLTEKKYRVFFSRITLEDKLGQEYEPYIFAALNSAKVMLVIGTDYDHFEAVWVRNEWSRYLKLMETDKNKHLIPCFKNIDAYDIPKEFNKLQAQDLGKVGAIQDLLRGVDKLIAPNTASTATTQASADIVPLLNMGNEALEKGEWDIASSRFDLALTVNPMCPDAYLGKLMAEFKCKERTQLAKAKKPLKKSSNYAQALLYSEDTLKQELQAYCKQTIRRHRVCVLLICTALIVSLTAAVMALEQSYRNIILNYYEGEISDEVAYDKLSAWAWYRTPDRYTQYKLQKAIPGAYPDADTSIITSVAIPDGATSIVFAAFRNCDKLTSITIPDSVTTIERNAFNGCVALTSITIPDSVTTIGERAFNGCVALTSITIPDSVTTIERNAFNGCVALTSITIPDSVTTIGERAFYGCVALTSITIPDSVTTIGKYAFAHCENLETIYCEAEEQPDGWSTVWNDSCSAEIVWGYKK